MLTGHLSSNHGRENGGAESDDGVHLEVGAGWVDVVVGGVELMPVVVGAERGDGIADAIWIDCDTDGWIKCFALRGGRGGSLGEELKG